MTSPRTTSLLRALAVAIGVAGAVDPAITSTRPDRPVIAVVAADPGRDSALARTVARDLAADFSVIPARFAGGDATVIAGEGLPEAANAIAAPVLAVVPARPPVAVRIEAVRAPASASVHARVPVVALVHVTGARGRTLDVSLRSGGVRVDRVRRVVEGGDERVPLTLTYVPTDTGALVLSVDATLTGPGFAATPARADLALDVRERTWSVLVHDARPSWMSTFVRRAIEGDRRFAVASRVVTSRGVSASAGGAPARLEVDNLRAFDAIVVGAPESLTGTEVAGLERFMRARGGTVVLLLDQRAAGPHDRLVAAEWTARAGGPTFVVTPLDADTATLRATEVAWPTAMPAGAEAIALATEARNERTASRPVVWATPVGAGRLVVSGALDAWRFRDRSGFDVFWRAVVSEAAASAMPPLALIVTPSVAVPGEAVEVAVTLRDAALGSVARARVSATVEAGGATLRLWPDGAPGRFRGVLRAPAAPGAYRVAVTANAEAAGAPLVVGGDTRRAAADATDLLGAFVASRGGRVVAADQLRELRAALYTALQPVARPVRWHPMRSAWWIVPFALALALEWWLRRRNGLA